MRTLFITSIAVALLLLIALMAGVFIGPVLSTRKVISQVSTKRLKEPAAIARLGGKERAVERIGHYLRLPGWIAPEKSVAVGLLAECDAPAVQCLVAVLANKKSAVRSQAALALGSIGEEAVSAIPMLAQCLRDEDADVADSAQLALGSIGPQAISAVRLALRARDSAVRRRAISALRQMGPGAIPDLLYALSDEDQWVRFTAALAFYELGAKAKDSAATLGQALAEEPDRSVRANIVGALGRMGSGAKAAVPELGRLLAAEDAVDMRLVTIAALGHIGRGAAEAIPALETALRDKRDCIRGAAAEALRNIRGWAYPGEKPEGEGAPNAGPEPRKKEPEP